MAFTVIYDACVLYPAPLRDLLMRLAIGGLVRARWTDEILDECFRAIARNRPELDQSALERTRARMIAAVPDCLVTGHEQLTPSIELPDPDDRHVVAAAIRGGAQTIVTFNLRDFPAKALTPYEIEAMHPDDFVCDAIDLDSGTVCRVIREQADALSNPQRTPNDVLERLGQQGLPQSVSLLRKLM